jgi:amino acid adenylation domain-containing protein
MVPSSLVQLDKLPLTHNGKVDRRKLPDIAQERPQLDSEYVAPSTPLQTELHAVWSDVMNLPRIGVNDDFFELGGDSVMSIRIAAQAQALGLKLNPRQLFLTPTIARLADTLMTNVAKGKAAATQSRVSIDQDFAADVARICEQVGEDEFADFEDIYPLTPLQEGILFHATANPDSRVYFGQVSCPVSGRIDLGKLQQAWQKAVARHPVLRTSFFWEHLDRPMQVVRGTAEPVWRSVDWRNQPADEAHRNLGDLQAELMAEGFDLRKATPMRICFVRTAANRGHLIWNVHHILLDGWSAYPILSEWFAHYEALLQETDRELPLPRPFGDYVRWQASQDKATNNRFWHDYLAGYAEPTPLCPTSPRRTGEGDTKRLDLAFSNEQRSALRTLARSHRVTLNTVFQAAWAILVSRYSGNNDVVYGTTVSGRNVEMPGVDSIIGLLLNSLPVRIQVDENVRVNEWLPSVQETLSLLGQFEATPLSDIRRASDLAADQELFDNILVFENYPSDLSDDDASLAVGELQFNAPSHYPLAVLVYPDTTLSCSFIFNDQFFSEHAIRQMSAHLSTLLDAMAAEPESMVCNLCMLSSGEFDRLISEERSYPQSGLPELLTWRISEQCAASPDATAIDCGDARISYSDLDTRARKLSRQLNNIGIGRNDIVAIEAARTPDFIIAMLGVWQAGAAFVPIDPDYPASRTQAIIADAEIKAIVAMRPSAIDVPDYLAKIDVDSPGATIGIPTSHVPDADDLAYVLYTSGSTGRPKGVMVSHRSISLSTAARPVYYPGSIERFLMLPSFAFDSSLAGLLWTLHDGGEILLPDPGKHNDLIHLSNLINRREVSHVLTLPSFYESLLDSAGDDGYPLLKIAIVAGEPCQPRTHKTHIAVCPDADLYNEYGPTEGTVWSHVYRFPKQFSAPVVPIGKPALHIIDRVLDGQKRPVPVGVPGELYLGGPGIADGYLNDEHLTGKNFLDLPRKQGNGAGDRFYRTGDMVRRLESGDLEFLGRIDEQIKIRGYRVEPAEIEAALLGLPALTGVVVMRTCSTPARLVAWYTSELLIDTAILRQSILDNLPAFMLPDEFVHCEEFPLLPNGKIDRSALTTAFAQKHESQKSYRAPENRVQQALTIIWAEGLGVDRVGIDDNFFDLGGDSLTAMRLAARAHRQELIVAPADILHYATIRDLSVHACADAVAADKGNSLIPAKFELTGLSEDEMTDLLDELEP